MAILDEAGRIDDGGQGARTGLGLEVDGLLLVGGEGHCLSLSQLGRLGSALGLPEEGVLDLVDGLVAVVEPQLGTT